MMNWEEMYDILRDVVGVSTEALDLVFSINGCNEKTAEDVLYYYTSWRDFEAFLEEANEEEA